MRRAPTAAATLLLVTASYAAAQFSYKTGIDVVSFSVTVLDRTRRPVRDLSRDDFEILEDGVPQTLAYFSPGSDETAIPLHVGLLFDTSESMEQDLAFSRGAAIKFLGLFPKALDFTLVDFDREVRAARFSQSEFPRLVERIRNRPAKGSTAMYDALSVYLGSAFDQTGRKVLVVYTDGGDTASSRTWAETTRILKDSDVTVYSIGFMGHQLGSSRFQLQSRLTDMAALTGGLAFFPVVMRQLDSMYSQIATEMRAQYTLGYVSTNPTRNGAWRKVGIRVTRPNTSRLTVRTREGYFAPTK